MISDVPATPAEVVWVAPGQAAGNGSRATPYATIQQAVAAARPGTAILVRAGEYRENVMIPKSASGTPAAPIWLVSIDGPQKARVIAPDSIRLAGIGGGGVQNFIVQGLWVTGGRNGIQFSQNGYAFDKMIRNIVIRGNLIDGARQDGIKVNGGENVIVENNVTCRTGDQGVDFVAIVGGRIANNEISQNTGPAALFAKGGSQDIVIAGNHIHNVSVDGIAIGGWMSPNIPYRPGYDSFEARKITVKSNWVEKVGKRPLNVLGGKDSVVSGNYFQDNPNYYTVIEIGPNNPKSPRIFQSSNIRIVDNIITRDKRQMKMSPGSEAIVFARNIVANQRRGQAGANLAAGSAIPQGWQAMGIGGEHRQRDARDDEMTRTCGS